MLEDANGFLRPRVASSSSQSWSCGSLGLNQDALDEPNTSRIPLDGRASIGGGVLLCFLPAAFVDVGAVADAGTS